jgi:hypothetical protein
LRFSAIDARAALARCSSKLVSFLISSTVHSFPSLISRLDLVYESSRYINAMQTPATTKPNALTIHGQSFRSCGVIRFSPPP